jgi:hypothetical protein
MTRNLVSKLGLGRAFRAAMLGGLVLAVVPTAVGCLDRPVAPASPRTSNTLTDQVRVSAVDKIDILFMIDNSASMADKQKILKDAVPDLIDRLINPQCVTTDANNVATPLPKDQQPAFGQPCPGGSGPEFTPITDIHIGVVTSSLGAHGGDGCVDVNEGDGGQSSNKNFTKNDHGHLITRGPRTDPNVIAFPQAATYNSEGFLAWDPSGTKNTPAGEADPVNLKKNFQDIVIGTDQAGCGFESQLEGWYRFLIDPQPPTSVTLPTTLSPQVKSVSGLYGAGPAVVDGIDEVLLKQRSDFLRPDSLVSIVMLTDENDCSVIDGQLPSDVCDKPVLGDDGKPTGDCQEARKGWPAGYGVEGNMQGYTTDADGRVTGSTFAANYLVVQYSYPTGTGGNWRMYGGTSACATDPNSPDCVSCLSNGATGPGCSKDPLPAEADDIGLRCWEPKRRFGVDPFYPLGRYVNGLTQTTVYDRGGNLVTNPLYDDLPYNAAKAAGTPLARAKATPRDAKLVFFAGIVGVPWQDIAKNPQDLTEGYLPGVPVGNDTKSIDWKKIYGDPTTERDPLMIETNANRMGTNVLGEALSSDTTMWNSINGHEWLAGTGDLQYACIFNLPSPTMDGADCKDMTTTKNPLCEAPSAADPKKGDGKATSTQYRAKAYPGLRYMPVLEQVKENGILASICSPNVTDQGKADYGYRPAVNAIIDRLKTQLTGRCLPRQLAPNPDGSTPCLIIDARYLADKNNPPPAGEVTECKKCNGTARKQIDPTIIKSLTGDVLNYECLCEVTQVTGADLKECTTVKNLQSFTSSSNAGGWCYVDPSAISSSTPNAATLKEQASAIVEKCGANEKRTIRFVNAGTENTTLFITCLGAASGTSSDSDTPGLGSGSAGTTGASGSSGAGGGN